MSAPAYLRNGWIGSQSGSGGGATVLIRCQKHRQL